MIDSGKVETKTENGIGTISFSHPQSNSLPGALLRLLADEITIAGDDPTIKIIVLRSDGDKAFCAGASFDELLSIDTFEKGKTFFSGFASVINSMRNLGAFRIELIT